VYIESGAKKMSAWNYSVFWEEAKKQIREEIGEHEYSMWFNIGYVDSRENTIVLGVPSSFYRDQIVKNYQPLIKKHLFDLSGSNIETEFVIVKKGERDDQTIQESKPVPQQPNHVVQPTQKAKEKHPDLRIDYTFENFIIGENNNFAANAAIAIANNPGTAYNPFLIYGGVGLGKTHLMQSIGNRIWATNEKAKIICITAEEFTNEFTHSIQVGKPQAFKNKYRYADVLLIDDIHFFQDKEGTQEELFHTFNALYDWHKQMVFTCDRPVSELSRFSDRLKSRFERGLNVDLQPPNFETRFAILRKKLEKLNLQIPDDVIDVVAKNISTNVRDLESALTKLVAYANIVKKEITVEIAQQQLKDVFNQFKQSNVTIDHILRIVSSYYKISTQDLKGKKRTKNIVHPRQVAMYISRELTEYSTTELGLEFGGRDHTTVMHACQKIDELLKTDSGLDTTIQGLIRQIKEASVKN
jgi:chromosomal replication initiator protein